jgi:hypothetical protein
VANPQAPLYIPLGKTSDEITDRNFLAIYKALQQACPVLAGALTADLSLVAGTNLIKPPNGIKTPRGGITVWQDSNIILVHLGMDTLGNWQVASTGTTKARFILF